ncbi:SRPBCC family protein [Paenibacillus sp. GYB006]|uniref:SRPBCC family protein n=1 Tax=Paenibacillus sp. GYB006 TaxID=2994394 RepID=UPI002F965096
MEVLHYEFYIGASPDQVWDTLFQPENTKKIFYGCTLESSFETGSSFQYVGPGKDGERTIHLYGEVLSYEPGVKFSCLEHPGPSYKENHEELASRMTYLFEPVGDCTKLTLINDQWSENHPSYESTKSHWWMILSNIKTLAETGKTLHFGF